MSKELEISTIGCPFRKNNKLCTSEIRLFKSLPKDVQEDLVNHSDHIQYPKGKIIAQEGDKIDSVLIIRHGRIKTCRYDANGEEYIMDVLTIICIQCIQKFIIYQKLAFFLGSFMFKGIILLISLNINRQ